MRQDPSSKSLIRNSVDEIARRSPTSGECAPSRGVRSIKKNRQFLANSEGTWYCFSEIRLARLTHPMGVARPGLRRQDRKMARKWRRNQLKSLKTDSEMASRRLAIVKGSAATYLGGTYPRRSGGTDSLASESSASWEAIAVCALEPRRRTDTVFSLASLRPRAMRTGTFASECSRTL
jgi:hypothetical protein